MARFSLSPSRIARYFFHNCERHLRYHATPAPFCAEEGVPSSVGQKSTVTQAVLEAGYVWEELVVGTLLRGKVHIASSPGPLRERTLPFKETLERLGELREGEALYQPTLLVPSVFLERYGLSPQMVEFPACRPDLLLRLPGKGLRFRVVDVKASDLLKASHRIQTALYALILRDMLAASGKAGDADLETAGLWLFQSDRPTEFSLSLTTGILETFLRDKVPELLTQPAREVPWHLFFRCEWCEYYPHCRQEAEETESVSLLPYLSVGGRRHLREAPWPGGRSVNTLSDLHSLLKRDPAGSALLSSGSLRGKQDRLKTSLEALLQKKVLPHGGSSVALPVREDVVITLTLQTDPHSSQIYALGFRRLRGKEVYGTGASECLLVASAPEKCEQCWHEFLEALYEELLKLHEYNASREWKDQKTLQVYVFDPFEADLLHELLLKIVQRKGADSLVALKALRLLFHFQSEHLAGVESQPDKEVAFPLVVLSRVLRQLLALPVPVALKLSSALRVLPSSVYPFQLEESGLFDFELSNRLRSDALFMAWHEGKDEALPWIRHELSRRLIALSTLLDGVRERVSEHLFAWPPRFRLPDPWPFVNPLLSRLAFIVRYETFMAALGVRESRTRPYAERIREGISLELVCLGREVFALRVPLEEALVEDRKAFLNCLLVRAGDEGERAQMCYDDHAHRSEMWSPKGMVRVASIKDTAVEPKSGKVERLTLEIKAPKSDPPLEVGAGYVLHPRYTDFTSGYILERLREIDGQGSGDFHTLLQEPSLFASPVSQPPRHEAMAEESTLAGFTASQREAFKHVCDFRLTLVWGPPGTGKTHFLARALRGLQRLASREGREFRVGVTAFTHAALENLLAEVQETLPMGGLSRPAVKLGRLSTPRGESLSRCSEAEARTLFGPDLVIGGTVYAFRKAAKEGLEPFDLLIVDEASQMKLYELALAMKLLSPMGRLVLAGDDLQLPPIISGHYPEASDHLPGLHDSAFTYLRSRDSLRPAYTFKLLENWRMNTVLSRFPARTLYGENYRPATKEVAERTLCLRPAATTHPLEEYILEPNWPLVVCILEEAPASIESRPEAEMVATLAVELRHRMLEPGSEVPFSEGEAGDRRFWRRGVFVVSPHHAQKRAILTELNQRYPWKARPFVDTVDKMQGQQCEAVLVSYGVGDPETALAEAAFIYSLNRLNVSVTRARSKTVVLLSRTLLEPSLEVLSEEDAAKGLGHMHALLSYCRDEGEEHSFERAQADGTVLKMTVFRATFPVGQGGARNKRRLLTRRDF